VILADVSTTVVEKSIFLNPQNGRLVLGQMLTCQVAKAHVCPIEARQLVWPAGLMCGIQETAILTKERRGRLISCEFDSIRQADIVGKFINAFIRLIVDLLRLDEAFKPFRRILKSIISSYEQGVRTRVQTAPVINIQSEIHHFLGAARAIDSIAVPWDLHALNSLIFGIHTDIFSISNCPVDNLEMRHLPEFPGIVRYKGHAETQGMSTDKHVHRAHGFTPLFEISTE